MKNKPLTGILVGILCLISLCGLSVGFLISVDWLYRMDVRLLEIPTLSGFPEEVIFRNYHAAVQFLNPLTHGDFLLPDLAVS